MAIEGGGFTPGLWYDYCKNCHTWYPKEHICLCPPPPPLELWQKMYLASRKNPFGSLKHKMLTRAWIEAIGGTMTFYGTEDDLEPLAGNEPCSEFDTCDKLY